MNIIEDVISDLKRCEKVLSEKNYLEIVIAIEELQDKYRNIIKSINETNNHTVWNYNIKDLEKIRNYLIDYKEELILKEKLKNIYEKISDLKLYANNNNIQNKKELIEIINGVEEVNNKKISLEEKYEEIKDYFNLIKYFDRHVAVHILELFALVIK